MCIRDSQSSDIQTSDYFGWSVSIHGDYIIAGARNEDTGGSNAGSAYIFKRDGTTWSQQAKIQSKHTSNDDNFGSSVSIHGDYAIIAAYLYDEDHPDVASNRGTAYIFKREGTAWSQQIQLQPSDPGAEDYFGGDTQGVDIHGDYAVVGAHLEDTNGSNAGSAYVFKKTSTTLSLSLIHI